MIFTTERLQFEEFLEGDEGIFKVVYSDPEAVKYVGDGEAISDEACVLWLRKTLDNYRSRGYGMLKIKERCSGELIGCGGIVHPGNQDAPEIKYCFLKQHWGKGFASEAVRVLILYGLKHHGYGDYVATVAPGNIASQKVLIKCGFKPGGPITEVDGQQALVLDHGDRGIQSKLGR